jgi:hypothetical protein
MYKRIIRFEAIDVETGELLFETTEHRITFELDIGMAQGLAKSKLVIYNLAEEERKRITKGDLEPTSIGDATENRELKKVRVKLYVGYKDQVEIDKIPMQLILDGFVMNATSVKKIPENLTYLYIIAFGSNFLINEFASFKTPGFNSEEDKMTIGEVITKICVGAGYDANNIDFNSVPEELMAQEVVGKTIGNDERGMFAVLNELSERYNFSWGVRNNGIGIYPQLKDSEADSAEFNYLQANGERLVIDPVNIKGTPIGGIASLEINHILDATLFPGVVIDVGELGGRGGNESLPDEAIIDYTYIGNPLYYTNDVSKYAVFQYYMLYRVVHKGDTHGEDWTSTLVCKTPSSGITANNEVN